MHADDDDDAQIGVVIGVDERRLERLICLAMTWRWQARDDRLEHIIDADPGLGRDFHRIGGVEADHVLDLFLGGRYIGSRQVDLVEHRHDFVVLLDRLIDIGQSLGFDALTGINHQKGSFAGGQAPADFIGEIHVPGRVHQVQGIGLAILGGIVEAHGLSLDGNPALFLDVHRVEHLLRHFAFRQRARLLDQAVREGRLAMVNMGDNREIWEMRGIGARMGLIGELGIKVLVEFVSKITRCAAHLAKQCFSIQSFFFVSEPLQSQEVHDFKIGWVTFCSKL